MAKSQPLTEADLRTERDLKRVATIAGLSAGIGLVGAVVYGALLGGNAWAGALVWALAALACGAALGFLFGIPRVLQEGVNGSANAGNGGKPGYRQQVNTNLEQISDWITKILVGIGLVELREMPRRLVELSRFAAESICEPNCPDAAASFAMAVLAYFAVVGFLFSYMLTRMYLQGAFARAEHNLGEVIQKLTERVEEAAQISEASALGRIRGASPAAAEPGAGPAAAAFMMPPADPATFDPDDPNRGQFGGQPEREGYKLSATVAPSRGLRGFFDVELTVHSTNRQRPLTESVTFYLHPTFGDPRQIVRPVENAARLTVKAWGAFTVGAVVGDVRLELDLAGLEDAPKEFREN